MKTTIAIIVLFAATSLTILKAEDNTRILNTYDITSQIIEENILNNLNKEVRLNGMYLEMSNYFFELYRLNNYKPIWTDSKNEESTKQVISLLKNAPFFGINTAYFPIDFIEHIQNDINRSASPEKVAMRKTQLEFVLSNSVFQFIALLKYGESQYTNYEFFEQDIVDFTYLPNKLWSAIKNKMVIETIIVNEPKTNVYQSGIREIDFLILLIQKYQAKHSKKEAVTKEAMIAYTQEQFPSDNYLNNYLKERLSLAVNENFEAWNTKYELNKMKPHYLTVLVYNSAQDLIKTYDNNVLNVLAENID